MYIFSTEDERCITELIPPKDDNLRGYNISSISTDFENLRGLNVSTVTDTFCETFRKAYLVKRGTDFGSSKPMIIGGAVHSLVYKIFNIKIKNSSNTTTLMRDIAGLLDKDRLIEIIWGGSRLQELYNLSEDGEDYQHSLDELLQTLRDITKIEIERLKESSKYSHDVKIFDLERYVDGSVFNLNKGKVDLIAGLGNSRGICDLKTGTPYRDNIGPKLQITLYAIMLENELKINFDWGCIIFPYDKVNWQKTLLNKPIKMFFPISDDLRRKILERLETLDIILASDNPPESCRKRCNSMEICKNWGVKNV